MSDPADLFGFNAGYIETIYADFLADPHSVGDEWRRYFEALPDETAATLRAELGAMPVAELPATNGARKESAAAPSAPRPAPADSDVLEPLRGVATRIVANMEASLEIPTATSVRSTPVKVLEENRRIINRHLEADLRGKASFTHLVAWAIVRALARHRALNASFELADGAPHRRVPAHVNLGVAVDLPKPDGTRTLVVPNVKSADALDFAGFLAAVDGVIARARAGQLAPADFQGTTITLTNPGTIGTVASVPRLMKGQGAIVATGAIDFPAEFQGMSEVTRSALGVSKVMTLTCTYDHRVIQGAESGAFLQTVHELLAGEHEFYEEVFAALTIPHRPWKLVRDRNVSPSSPFHVLYTLEKSARVMQLVNMYRVRGYLLSNLDPLEFRIHRHRELDLDYHALTLWDLDREFFTAGVVKGRPIAPLREILETLQDTYCRKIGVEYMHIADPEQKGWLQERMESTRNSETLSKEEKLRVLRKLDEAELFERFLHRRYVGHKRFSLEGAETLIPVLDELLRCAVAKGAEEVVIGMAHRGRLNVLANTVGKSYEQIFSEFEGVIDPESTQGSGDVKYHLGAVGVHVGRAKDGSERALNITLASNPSHLEAVNPVVEGVARAKQELRGDAEGQQVLPWLIHGDAAFAGQGVVAETLNLSQLPGYRTGGTVHVIVNNQIGYTTLPADARSSPYCTDVAKMIQAPIFHVNGDDPLAAVRAARIAFEFRERFRRDVVIDVVCYRRHGHNEGDEPSFTQPLLYQTIEQHPSVREIFTSFLVRSGDLTEEEARAFAEAFTQRLSNALDSLRTEGRKNAENPDAPEKAHDEAPSAAAATPDTTVESGALLELAEALCTWPASFTPHVKIERLMQRRRAMAEKGEPPIDYAFAETLAFASLLRDGVPVRLSGQDSGRGTFSQRHSVLLDVKTGDRFVPLNHLGGRGATLATQATYTVVDSLLSEEAVLGFEYGYSVANPGALVMWEAQFGDFSNGAQVQIDQFLASGEAKWGQESGLVLLLPHGYDGQGPEHSSARLERFLQLAAQENIRVANPSTAAQIFHLLRHQALARPRKPLIVMTPKSGLRDPAAGSRLEELANGSFQPVMDDAAVSDGAACRRVLLASGKVALGLVAARGDRRDVAVVRVERLYPFPAEELAAVLARFPSAEAAWVQEEPENMGAWRFVAPHLYALLGESRPLRRITRPESASPATGSARAHAEEQEAIVREALV